MYRTNMIIEGLTSTEAVETGNMDALCLVERVELNISKVEYEALSRKEILEKGEKLFFACEEGWMEDFYHLSNGRGADLVWKHTAHSVLNKIPAMADTLTSETNAWETARAKAASSCSISSILQPKARGESVFCNGVFQKPVLNCIQHQKELNGKLMAEQGAL